jgi:PAS domain S-box-containing protein
VTERKLADNNLRESEFTIRTLMESTSQGILAVNEAGNIVLANLRAASMFGYRKSDFVGRPIFDLIPPDLRQLHQKKHIQFFRKPNRGPMDTGLNLSGLHKGGREFPVEISLSSIQVNHETLAVAFVTDISKRKESEALLQESHDQRVALSHSLMTAHDEASRRLSRELHDVFSQELAALATESRLLKRDLPRQETAAAEKVEGLALRITKLAKDMHQMSRRLHPAVLDELGLQAALRAECNAFSHLHGIPTIFRSKRPIQALNPDVALCLYRVTQESLRNIAKHSGTKTVAIDLVVKKGILCLKIEDFGRGFDTRSHGRKNVGLGIISMTERTRAVGGSLTVDSKSGRGTIITARVPLETGD